MGFSLHISLHDYTKCLHTMYYVGVVVVVGRRTPSRFNRGAASEKFPQSSIDIIQLFFLIFLILQKG